MIFEVCKRSDCLDASSAVLNAQGKRRHDHLALHPVRSIELSLLVEAAANVLFLLGLKTWDDYLIVRRCETNFLPGDTSITSKFCVYSVSDNAIVFRSSCIAASRCIAAIGAFSLSSLAN
ncbi:hypothetical protein AUC45_01715 [Erythrobacter sp. YT30]|nr:hypothetical protein AUC45_01715 [Erythrobacter sp. YT30]